MKLKSSVSIELNRSAWPSNLRGPRWSELAGLEPRQCVLVKGRTLGRVFWTIMLWRITPLGNLLI